MAALKFFEESGEVPVDLRLSRSPALEGAVREFEAARRKQAELAGEQLQKKQAPQMLVAILVKLEEEVLKSPSS